MISLIGASGVGKTHLVSTYLNKPHKFYRRYGPTMGVEFDSKVINLDGESILLKIIDFGGTCINDANFQYQFVRYGHIPAGLILAYDITNQSSFLDIMNWYDKLESQISSDIPAVLVGMKADKGKRRQVTQEEVKNFAKQKGIICITEVSANEKLGCEFVFVTLAALIARKYPDLRQTKRAVSTNPGNDQM